MTLITIHQDRTPEPGQNWPFLFLIRLRHLDKEHFHMRQRLVSDSTSKSSTVSELNETKSCRNSFLLKKGRALQKISRCSIHCTHLLLCWSLCKSHWFSTTSAEQNKTKPVTVFSFFLLSFNKRTITKLTDSQQSRASSSSVSGTKFSTRASRPSSFYLIGQLVHWFSKSLFLLSIPKFT